MGSFKTRLQSSTVIPAIVGTGIILAGALPLMAAAQAAGAGAKPLNPPAVSRSYGAMIQLAGHNPCHPRNPCAAKNPCNPCAAKNPCNPCGAKNPCNPCAAKNPCGACNPCNPCAGGGAASSKCVVPRLAAKGPCSPCGAKNPCNPCGAKNPCNPCAAKNPCNPCAAKNPCNPCAAKNPCNPCAAKNPCGPCNPCNPCGGAAYGEITHAEAHKVYGCLIGGLKAGYAKAGVATVKGYTGWANAAKQPYVSATHGSRYVNNYVNRVGAAEYKRFEKVRTMPVGSVVAKDSFSVKPNGKAGPGPLFVMEKMKAGFAAKTGDWKYTMVMPNGMVYGETGGKNSKGMVFCAECHAAVAEDQDYLLLVPDEYRMK